MFRNVSGLVALLGIAMASAAHAEDGIKVDLGRDVVRIEFPEPMRVLDNVVPGGLLTSEPKRRYRCAWEDDHALDCAINGEPLPPATRVTLHLGQGLFTAGGLAVPAQRFVKETERPSLSAQIAEWVRDRPRIVVRSGLQVTTDDAARVLRLRSAGREWPVSLRQIDIGNDGNPTTFELALPDDLPHGASVTLQVVPGLRSSAGPLPGTQDRPLLEFVDREPFRLREVVCSGPKREVQRLVRKGGVATRCVPGEPVWLLFSSPMDDAGKAALAASLPGAMTIEAWNDEVWGAGYRYDHKAPVQRHPSRARLRYGPPSASEFFLLGSTLRDGQGRALQPVRLRIETLAERPRLESDARRLLLGDLRHASVRSVNAASVILTTTTLARGEADAVVTAPDSTNRRVDIEAPLSAQALAEGGWSRWSHSRVPLVDVAAPRFELAAQVARRAVVVWATEWSGGDAIPGAEIELLLLEDKASPRRVAIGRSDRDGVVRLALPEDFRLPPHDADAQRPQWVLRARDGQRMAVLPLEAAGYGTTGLGSDVVDARLWGVADRPLYRAGDTVRYRLWQRDRREGRLRALRKTDTITLRLVSRDDDKTLATWSTTVDAFGAITGETRLPQHLVDGDYCIGEPGRHYPRKHALCFFVGTYRPQDFWARASTEDRVLRDGDAFNVDMSAGYYSGGVAAGLQMSEVSARLEPWSLSQAYPAFVEYDFIDVDGRDGAPLEGARDLRITLDGDGKARIALPVRFAADRRAETLPAFGRLRMTAGVKLEAGESTSTNAAEARYARFERYVGLKIEPRWLDASTPLRLTGVVVDAEGRAQPRARIEVGVEFEPYVVGFAGNAAKRERVATCTLIAGETSTCDVPRKRSGRYVFVARSGDAAPVDVDRHAWIASAAVAGTQKSELEVLQHPSAAKPEVRVLLRQPHARARALLLVESEGVLLDHAVVDIEGATSIVGLPVRAPLGSAVNLHAVIREHADASIDARGLRRPVALASMSVPVKMPPRERSTDVALSLDAERAVPGRVVRIRLHNRSGTPRSATLAVVDDALLALGVRWWSAFDPMGAQWLGKAPDAWQGRPGLNGFWNWNQGPWQLPLPWPAVKQPADDIARNMDIVREGPPAPPGEPPVVFDDPSSVDAPAPTNARSDAFGRDSYGYLGGADLDRIEVTGSRVLRRAEVEEVSPVFEIGREALENADMSIAEVLSVRDGVSPDSVAPPPHDLFGARLRRDFAETALWMPNLRLAPGETRDIEFAVPDNLTRWRVVAWSSDRDDGFEMAEVALEVGLPLEVRVQAPVRLYPGDSTDLIANLRHAADTVIDPQATLRVDALGADATKVVRLPAKGSGSLSLRIAPGDDALADGARTLGVVAAARHGEDRDAVSASIELASPTIETRKVQAGWLGAETRVLPLPTLPAGAGDARLSVTLLPGADGLVRGWIEDLRDYPHRCWEQILSRGIAAAIALERDGAKDWPDAKAVLHEALENAPVFQNGEGGFRYFADVDESWRDSASVPLTAYSLRALRFLQARGHAVDAQLLASAERFLERASRDVATSDELRLTEGALASAALAAPDKVLLARLYGAWKTLPLPAQVATAQAMAASGDPAAAQAASRLLAMTTRRGETRAFTTAARHDYWMSSDQREQCELVALLRTHPAYADAATRRSLVAGLGDLYAGGSAAVDTQAGAICLMALRGLEAGAKTDAPAGESPAARLDIALGAAQATLSLASANEAPIWAVPVATKDATRPLTLNPEVRGEAPASYRVEYRYTEDARKATSTAVGFSLQREYRVLRAGRWVPVAGQSLRDDDWVRVTLRLDTSAERYFVAITDAVPGGLRPTDLALGGVAGVDVQAVSDEGSGWFRTRRLDPRAPKFYAEILPAGRHEVHYFARVGNAGDYLAAPAQAELMYGAPTRARTAATRVVIEGGAHDRRAGP
jgi:uncharacterized protein YfaS (alpha-2-macroglobulin family)